MFAVIDSPAALVAGIVDGDDVDVVLSAAIINSICHPMSDNEKAVLQQHFLIRCV